MAGNLLGQEPWELRGAKDAQLAALQTRVAALEATLSALIGGTTSHAKARTWLPDANFSEFSDDRRGTAAGDYSFLSDSAGDTYINAKTGTGIHLRINNSTADALAVNGSRQVTGSYPNATFVEALGDALLAGGGPGNPNYIIKAGSLVGNFVGGNCHFTFAQAFIAGLHSLVASVSGGASGWTINTINESATGFGVSLVRHDGVLAGGLFRINYFALGY